MSYEKQIMQHYLVQIIKNLKKAGIEDFTTEDVTVAHPERGKLVVRFYTEEKWLADPALRATTAQMVMKQTFKGCKIPDHVVTFETVKYLVKVVK